MVRAPQACSHEESTPPKFSGTDGPASRLAPGLPNAHYSAWHTGTLESAPAAALGPTLTDASAQPSCSPLRLPNAGCLCNVTATLALDMNPSLLAPSFPSSRHEPQLARSLLLILTWFSASPPRQLSQPFHGPLGVSSLRRISSPAPPWLSGERPCPLASLLSRSVLPLPTSPPAATVTRQAPLQKFVPATFLSWAPKRDSFNDAAIEPTDLSSPTSLSATSAPTLATLGPDFLRLCAALSALSSLP